MVQKLGRGAFELLDHHEKCLLRLFIWAGCGCHKDLSTVRSGYTAMEKWWKEHGVQGPVILANQDNDTVLEERDQAIACRDEVTPAQDQALNRSTCGAIKTAQIAGAIFNHKDDKKGHHDFFRDWWKKHVGTSFTFPDTSNNRFQSYCYAAAALLRHLKFFRQFLKHLQITKQNGKLNHMESNLWKALHDSAMLSELASDWHGLAKPTGSDAHGLAGTGQAGAGAGPAKFPRGQPAPVITGCRVMESSA